MAAKGEGERGARGSGAPVDIRTTGIDVPAALFAHVHKRIATRTARFADRVERVTVRFEDVNGPRGGIGVECRAKAVLRRLPSVVVATRAATARLAFGEVERALTRTFRKVLERSGRSARARPRVARTRGDVSRAVRIQLPIDDEGSLIGRRVGRGKANLANALARPEKQRRDAWVDTSAPGVSATDRKAGGGATARRNTKARTPRAVAALEDSRTRPSRRSTRRSANRARGATNLQKKAIARATSPQRRARQALARRKP